MPVRWPEAEAPRPLLQRLAREGVQALAHRVEVDVRGLRQRARHVHRAERLLAGVARLLARGPDLDAAVVVDDVARLHHAAGHRRQRGDRLEGRAGRIGAADRAVEQRRAAAVAEQAIGGGLRERLGEDRRVDRGIGAQRQHAAVARVERDEAAGGAGARLIVWSRYFSPVCCRSKSSVVRTERPGTGSCPGAELFGRPERVDGDLGRAVDAAQVLVVGALQPALADHGALLDALEALELELGVVDLADAAHELSGQRVMRVAAQELALDVDAGEALGVLDQVVAPRDVDVDLDRDVGVRERRQRLHDALLDRLGRHVQHAREALEARRRGAPWPAAGSGPAAPSCPSAGASARSRAGPTSRPRRARPRAGSRDRAGPPWRRGSRRARCRCGRGCRRAAPARAARARGCRAPAGGTGRPRAPAGTTGGRR